MFAIFKKELWGHFGTLGLWLTLGIFNLVSTLFLFFFENDFNILEIGIASLQSYFSLVPWLLIFIIPALSMKTLAEEQQNGTLNWLFAQPLKIKDIILGKFLVVWLIGVLCIVPSCIYFYSVYTLGISTGNLDIAATLGSYIGVIFLIGGFSAVGILASSLSHHQIMAYLLGVFISFFIYFGIEQLASYKLLGNADFILQNIGFYQHFIGFTRGLIDTRDIFYFVFVMIISLNLSIYFVKKKK